ncbi:MULTISPECIES: hypothetical protein [unclassified Roseivivax]|nr:hypothetical protein [Roseivivax sp. GX 12232]
MQSWLNIVHVCLIATLVAAALFVWTSHLDAGPEALELRQDLAAE